MMFSYMSLSTVTIILLLNLLATTHANNRQPDPGPADDTLCTMEIVKMVRASTSSIERLCFDSMWFFQSIRIDLFRSLPSETLDMVTCY
jgi:hypothetical protein